MSEHISANSAFCECCGDRINLANGGATVRFCIRHRSSAGRAQHYKDQAALVASRKNKITQPATV